MTDYITLISDKAHELFRSNERYSLISEKDGSAKESDTDSETLDSPARTERRQSWFRQVFMHLLVLLITTILMMAGFLAVIKLGPASSRLETQKDAEQIHSKYPLSVNSYELPENVVPTEYHCGSNPAEAQALGCVFDIMNFAWTHPHCYDEPLASEYLSSGPWQWYADAEHSQPLIQDPNVLGTVELELDQFGLETAWTSLEYHINHCLYMWRLMHQAATGAKGTIEPIFGYNHTVHCAGFIRDNWAHGGEKGTEKTRSHRAYERCMQFV
ncbi:hypothetical protein AC579_6774 [Pseudocercospora musae]|uniref:Uncharacterized protein n=1 Tax=Pseudocercospora musae TaxID=113226 RepID=A0A139I3I1_9PEZI|nr:hypothetical protein AC579_6774 [Pseudocercospora musae]